jgi:Phorbol esters/diacylglycerol binding domain (C1 domain)
MAATREHTLKRTTFKRPTFCALCHRFIWGVRLQGFACSGRLVVCLCGFVLRLSTSLSLSLSLSNSPPLELSLSRTLELSTSRTLSIYLELSLHLSSVSYARPLLTCLHLLSAVDSFPVCKACFKLGVDRLPANCGSWVPSSTSSSNSSTKKASDTSSAPEVPFAQVLRAVQEGDPAVQGEACVFCFVFCLRSLLACWLVLWLSSCLCVCLCLSVLLSREVVCVACSLILSRTISGVFSSLDGCTLRSVLPLQM